MKRLSNMILISLWLLSLPVVCFAFQIEETGTATVDRSQVTSTAQAKVMALRTARQLAYQQLSDRVGGLLAALDEETRGALTGDRTIEAYNRGIVKGARVVPGSENTEVLADGSVLGRITLSLDLPDQMNPDREPAPGAPSATAGPAERSEVQATPATPAPAAPGIPATTAAPSPTLTPVSTPTPAPTSTVPSTPIPTSAPILTPTPTPTQTQTSTQTPTQTPSQAPTQTPTQTPARTSGPDGVREEPYEPLTSMTPATTAAPLLPPVTGLVVDARNLPFTPYDTPSIHSAGGTPVYMVNRANIRVAYTHGFVHYAGDPASPDVDRFAGENPLRVTALRVLSSESGDRLVVSDEDAGRIMAAEAQHSFLCKCRVVIIVSAPEEVE